MISKTICLVRLGHGRAQRKVHVRAEKEESYLKAKERGLLWKNQSYQNLDLWLQASRIMRKIDFCCSSKPACGALLGQPLQTYMSTKSQALDIGWIIFLFKIIPRFIYTKDMKVGYQRYICSSTFVAVLVTIAKIQK